MKWLYGLILYLFLCLQVDAQQFGHSAPYAYSSPAAWNFEGYATPSSLSDKDSNKVREPWSEPKKAAVMSAIIPGSGQLYNRKYLKAGILYAGVFGLGFAFISNVDSLRGYQKALVYRIDDDPNTVDLQYSNLTDAKVLQERNFYRRNRDILILSFVGLYALQIIDANVDAHLKEFEINEDLSLRFRPKVDYDWQRQGWRTQFSLGLRF
jgi:TM2 domain-containing membrane protein YozV